MLEQEYLELSNQLKESFDKKEKEVEKIKEELTDLKKIFVSAYGFVRIMDNIDDWSEKEALLDLLRSYLSEQFENRATIATKIEIFIFFMFNIDLSSFFRSSVIPIKHIFVILVALTPLIIILHDLVSFF